MANLIDQILTESKAIAVVGLSPNPERPSYRVAKYLKNVGYHIIPINPDVKEIDGIKSYPSLSVVPESIDLVNIFRRSEFVAAIVDEAINIGVKFIWMQDNVIDQTSAKRAQAAGIPVVMNNCTMREHQHRD